MSLRASLARPLGLRREVAILVPVSLLLLVVLSTFVLLSYRSAVERLIEERRDAARALAEGLAETAGSREEVRSTGALLLRHVPEVRRIALLDPRGNEVVQLGVSPAPGLELLAGEPRSATGQPPGPASRVFGPDAASGGMVVAVRTALRDGAPYRVRVDLDAAELTAQRRVLVILGSLSLGVDLALGVVLILFVRSLLRPYDLLLERSRQLRGDDGAPGGGDEVEYLLETFERALEALAAAGGPPAAGAHALAVLERTLGGSRESGVLLLDREGRVLALNPHGRELLALEGAPRGRAVGEALAGRPPLGELLAGAVEGGRPIRRHEVSLDLPGRGAATLGLTVHPLRGPDASARDSGHLVLFSDLTEVQRRARRERLREGLAELGELAAGVAHELRNSLATLRGYVTLLRRTGDDDGERRRGFVAEIERESDQLKRVVDDFLAFARPGASRIETLEVGDLVRRAVADPSLGAPVRLLSMAEGVAERQLRGDAKLLEQALRNLLHNAVVAHREAAEDGEAVEVGVAAGPGDIVVVRIADRGPGVPAEIAGRIFEPFVTGRPDGVGLGLALARRIALMHGGEVRHQPRVGGGSVFEVELPAGTFVTDGNDRGEPGSSLPAAGSGDPPR